MKYLMKTAAITALACLSFSESFAQDVYDDEIVVTGSRVTSGGAQDIKHFRGGVESGQVPTPEGMTSEGLLSEHDLYLTTTSACEQILCLNSSIKTASLVEGNYFAGFGFDTNISDDWDREPLNIVAVIDRSGSMGGDSIRNVKHSLMEITDNLRSGDQVSFVLYGSNVVTHLEPLVVTNQNKGIIRKKIGSIEIEGSTNMDAGLARGYDIAYNTKGSFEGTTRLMIFTDERPNTGRTDADGFMARAQRASLDGIGLTTIGYGVDYGGELAAKIASVRGGNLFYVGDSDDVENLFDKEFDFMVSEIAHDMTVRLRPAPGLKVNQIYGVPNHMMTEYPDGSVSMTVPTVFLSSAGGGLFASLDGSPQTDDAPLLEARLAYNEGTQRRTQSIEAHLSSRPELNLVKAEALSAQYIAMKSATEAYYNKDYETAFEIFHPFAKDFAAQKIDGLEEEYQLVANLDAIIAVEAGFEDRIENPPGFLRLRGEWEVTRADNFVDVHRGDRFDFEAHYVDHYRRSEGYDSPYETERYKINDEQIYLSYSDLTFKYSFSSKGHLRLRHRDGKSKIYMKPIERDGMTN